MGWEFKDLAVYTEIGKATWKNIHDLTLFWAFFGTTGATVGLSPVTEPSEACW